MTYSYRFFMTASALYMCATRANAQTPEQCRAILIAHGTPADRVGVDACLNLATLIVALAPSVRQAAAIILKDGAVPVGSIFSQRDLQARYTQQPSLAGSAAQGHAIPSVQPAGVASGSIAAVGTDAGNDAIAALGLNPAILFIADEASRQLSQYSRFADLTVFVPVSDIRRLQTTATQPPKKLEYLGVRLRLNATGISSGDAVWSGAETLIKNWISRSGRNQLVVRKAFAATPDLKACVDALLADTVVAAAITAGCGAPVTLDVDLEEAEQLRRALATVREAADSKYFGADVRADVGDPTLGTVPNSSGMFTFAGLAFGKRLGVSPANRGATYGVRSRLGVRHAKLDSVAKSEFAAEGDVGFELARSIDQQEINASAALEFRGGNSPANLTDQFQTNFVMFRASFLLPVTPGNSVSINLGLPVRGDVSRTLSVNFNWGLLLPDNRPR